MPSFSPRGAAVSNATVVVAVAGSAVVDGAPQPAYARDGRLSSRDPESFPECFATL